ncbi:hypothetical protein GCM10010420_07710 [Streptomyces glaucosporus]|uniref:Uncharacterized protein n=1 Tax=Streptomyces glaucosporus TaxID=284044 RepID=A0ABN3HSZ0_9ACTN
MPGSGADSGGAATLGREAAMEPTEGWAGWLIPPLFRAARITGASGNVAGRDLRSGAFCAFGTTGCIPRCSQASLNRRLSGHGRQASPALHLGAQASRDSPRRTGTPGARKMWNFQFE